MSTTLHTHTEKLAQATADYIVSERAGESLSFYNYPRHYFRFTPEMLLSTPLEVRRTGMTQIRDNRTWIYATVKVKGVQMTLTYPAITLGDGKQCDELCNPLTCVGLVESLKHHRPRKPLPLDFENDKSPVVFQSSTTNPVSSTEKYAEWTTPARPVAAVNAFLKGLGFTPLTTAEGNALLALLDETVAEHRVEVCWLDDMPSETYSSDTASDHYSSCMMGEDPAWFEIYDDFQRDGRLRMVGLFRNGERVGRALCWTGENPADLYLDRVYAPGHRSTFDNDVIAELQAFCAAEGIAKTVHGQTADLFGLAMTPRLKLRVPGLKDPDDYAYLPYMDSMKFHTYYGWLYNYEPSGRFATLQNTDGTAEGRDDDDALTEITAGRYAGSRVDEDDTIYFARLDETYHVDDTTYSDRLGERVVECLCVQHHSGDLIWEEDAIELYNGTYADDGDDVVALFGGWEKALREDTITLHDGSIHVTEDTNWVATADGEYALLDDCVEVDGVWYLEGDEPQPDAEKEEEENEPATATATATL